METTETKTGMNGAMVHLENLPPLKLADDQRVAGKFVDIYNKVHGNQMGGHVYEVEKFHFIKQLTEKEDLQKCSKLSLYGAFMDVAVQGLSFDPTKRLCYLVPYNVNAGTKDQPKWEKRASLQISPYGELYLRQYYGQIKTADNPVVVFEGDEFEVITTETGRVVKHLAKYPRESERIIACFVRIVKHDGTIDFGIIDELEMDRLKAYSAKKNNGKANALYGTDGKQFDTGFLIAKTIKHAFKAYPKVKLRGQFTKLETEVEEEEVINYDLPTTTSEQPKTVASKPEPQLNTANQSTTQMTVVSSDEDADMF